VQWVILLVGTWQVACSAPHCSITTQSMQQRQAFATLNTVASATSHTQAALVFFMQHIHILMHAVQQL
jgi:uncharacterized protein YmfQ (DUF2313 family)